MNIIPEAVSTFDYTVRLDVTDKFHLYLIRAERLVGYEVPFDLIWTTRPKDATRYSKQEAEGIIEYLLDPTVSWNPISIDDRPECIESGGQYIRRTRGEGYRRL